MLSEQTEDRLCALHRVLTRARTRAYFGVPGRELGKILGDAECLVTLIIDDSPDISFQPIGGCGGECLGVCYPRLLRDGWKSRHNTSPLIRQSDDVFEKPLPEGWCLRKIAHADVSHPVGKDCYRDEHELAHARTGAVIRCPDWEWADRDGDRLVWSSKGILYAGNLFRAALPNELGLADDTGLKRLPAGLQDLNVRQLVFPIVLPTGVSRMTRDEVIIGFSQHAKRMQLGRQTITTGQSPNFRNGSGMNIRVVCHTNLFGCNEKHRVVGAIRGRSQAAFAPGLGDLLG